jgi:hypothetical protein
MSEIVWAITACAILVGWVGVQVGRLTDAVKAIHKPVEAHGEAPKVGGATLTPSYPDEVEKAEIEAKLKVRKNLDRSV